MMKNKNLIIAAAICVLALAVMVVALAHPTEKTSVAEFTPPAFDVAAVKGVPDVAEPSWTQIYREGMAFSAHVCGNVVVNGDSADIYFTNDEGNSVWMKLRILDQNGKMIAETGLVKPGEYVKSIAFDKIPAKGEKIKMKIMAYEPDTYHSAGAVALNTTVGG